MWRSVVDGMNWRGGGNGCKMRIVGGVPISNASMEGEGHEQN